MSITNWFMLELNTMELITNYYDLSRHLEALLFDAVDLESFKYFIDVHIVNDSATVTPEIATSILLSKNDANYLSFENIIENKRYSVVNNLLINIHFANEQKRRVVIEIRPLKGYSIEEPFVNNSRTNHFAPSQYNCIKTAFMGVFSKTQHIFFADKTFRNGAQVSYMMCCDFYNYTSSFDCDIFNANRDTYDSSRGVTCNIVQFHTKPTNLDYAFKHCFFGEFYNIETDDLRLLLLKIKFEAPFTECIADLNTLRAGMILIGDFSDVTSGMDTFAGAAGDLLIIGKLPTDYSILDDMFLRTSLSNIYLTDETSYLCLKDILDDYDTNIEYIGDYLKFTDNLSY